MKRAYDEPILLIISLKEDILMASVDTWGEFVESGENDLPILPWS